MEELTKIRLTKRCSLYRSTAIGWLGRSARAAEQMKLYSDLRNISTINPISKTAWIDNTDRRTQTDWISSWWQR